MEPFETSAYLVRLVDRNNPEEIRKVQKLRYDHLLRDFDPSLPEDGLDDDGYDPYAESIVVIDKEKDLFVATYRLASSDTIQDKEYKCEEEFNIDVLKHHPEGMLEAGRAVVHKDYRDGAVVNLLWKGFFSYILSHNYRFVVGTTSLHGTDPTVHTRCTAYLRKNSVDERFNIRAAKNGFEYGELEEDIALGDPAIPGLLKTYLLLGAKVSANGYIDYDFNCCDVFTIVDVQTVNPRMVKFIMK